MNHRNNYIGYLKLIAKSSFETLRVHLHHQESRGIYSLNSETISVFFIFSLGRSGTQLFSSLLNKDPKASVFHEPLRRDTIEYMRSFSDNYNYDGYVKFRMKYIQSYVSHKNIKAYGEVNSVLRRHACAIMTDIPNVKGLYLIRDGRDVVRSMMSRGAMLNHWFYKKMIPQHDDPYFNAWHSMSQFEKCCWVWASENAMLYKQFGPALKFEILMKDYKYLQSNLLDVLHLNISKETWKKEILTKSENSTKQFLCEPYGNWPTTWKDSFWEICGDMMQKHGYCKNIGDHKE